MDITFVRQADPKSEFVKGKEIRFISIGGISDLSKSSLRILYECGKRPLYAFLDKKSEDAEISVISSPQKEPDCLLCGTEQHSFKSATVLEKQMSDVGVNFPIIKLSALSNSSSEETKKRLFLRSIQQRLHSLEQNGYKHVIIVADQKKLNDIYHMITKEDLPEKEDKSTCLWGIKNGQPAYFYNSQRVDYVVEGLLDMRLVSQINAPSCPKKLKKFQGKVKTLIDDYKLFYTFKKAEKS